MGIWNWFIWKRKKVDISIGYCKRLWKNAHKKEKYYAKKVKKCEEKYSQEKTIHNKEKLSHYKKKLDKWQRKLRYRVKRWNNASNNYKMIHGG